MAFEYWDGCQAMCKEKQANDGDKISPSCYLKISYSNKLNLFDCHNLCPSCPLLKWCVPLIPSYRSRNSKSMKERWKKINCLCCSLLGSEIFSNHPVGMLLFLFLLTPNHWSIDPIQSNIHSSPPSIIDDRLSFALLWWWKFLDVGIWVMSINKSFKALSFFLSHFLRLYSFIPHTFVLITPSPCSG